MENQTQLSEKSLSLSGSKTEKIRVISYLKNKGKEIGFEIEKEGLLWTRDPNCYINFWVFKFKDYGNRTLKEFF